MRVKIEIEGDFTPNATFVEQFVSTLSASVAPTPTPVPDPPHPTSASGIDQVIGAMFGDAIALMVEDIADPDDPTQGPWLATATYLVGEPTSAAGATPGEALSALARRIHGHNEEG